MNELTFNLIFSILLLPVNFCCAFWMFREVLKLSKLTFREFLRLTSHQTLPSGRLCSNRRRNFLFRFFAETSSDPQRSSKLLWVYGISTLPGLAALLLAEYAAISSHPDKIKFAFIGNVILVFVNIGLVFAGRIYRENHPLDEMTADILAEKRRKEKQEDGRRNRKKYIIIYAIVGAFFFTILLGFHLGIADVFSDLRGGSDHGQTMHSNRISHSDVNTVLVQQGFETANIPTTYWFYDENKLANVCAGVKDDTKFEFYEYTDGETTDGVYNSILYDITQDMEFDERVEHETRLPDGNKMFTVIIDSVYHLVMYQGDTVVYAYSSKSLDEINDILARIGYLKG